MSIPGFVVFYSSVDNSDHTRNGDYNPTRFLAQNEAVSYLANAKLQDNQESSVGLMSMAGNRIDVLCSPGREPGQLLNALAKDVKIGGRSNFIAALKTAQLALKNRQNKNQRQRVIMFVGSPIVAEADELVKVGKLFKKNNVALDVINFGTENTTNDNTEKLEQLIAAVNTSDNSHLVSIPPGPHIFADLVLTSAIMSSGGGGASIAGVPSGAGGPSAGGAGHPGGIDPSMDPEMAMAIRMSMEEERQRQQKAAGGDAAATAPATTAATGGAAPMVVEEDEEALLAQAIALSMQENADTEMTDASTAAAAPATTTATTAAAATPAPAASGADASQADLDLAMQDPDFINSLLAGVPGAEGDQMDALLDSLTGTGAAPASGSAAQPQQKKDEKKDAKK